MKKAIIVILIFIGIAQLSCEQKKEMYFQFEATVVGQGPDCGDTYLIDLKNISGDSVFMDGIYYADNLPSELKLKDLKIQLNCRGSKADEIYACTHMGPYYPHVFVINSKVSD